MTTISSGLSARCAPARPRHRRGDDVAVGEGRKSFHAGLEAPLQRHLVDGDGGLVAQRRPSWSGSPGRVEVRPGWAGSSPPPSSLAIGQVGFRRGKRRICARCSDEVPMRAANGGGSHVPEDGQVDEAARAWWALVALGGDRGDVGRRRCLIQADWNAPDPSAQEQVLDAQHRLAFLAGEGEAEHPSAVPTRISAPSRSPRVRGASSISQTRFRVGNCAAEQRRAVHAGRLRRQLARGQVGGQLQAGWDLEREFGGLRQVPG